MCETLIIGIGNPIRGDDALGWASVEALNAHDLPPDTRTLCVQQLTMDLVEEVAAARRVFFIDARAAEPPGALHVEHITPDTCLETHLTHFFDPRTLLAAVQALYGHHPPATLFSINTTAFAYGAPISPPVQRALPELLCRVRHALRSKTPQEAQSGH